MDYTNRIVEFHIQNELFYKLDKLRVPKGE